MNIKNVILNYFKYKFYPVCEVIFAAASLCKENTKYRNLKNLKVAYTFIGNLKKKEEIGSVYYHSNRKVKYINI